LRAIHLHAYVPGTLPDSPAKWNHMQPTPQSSQNQVSQGRQTVHQVPQVPHRVGEIRKNPTTAPEQIPIRGPRQGKGSSPPNKTSGDTRERDTGPALAVHAEVPPHQPQVKSRKPTTSQTATPKPDSTSFHSDCPSLSEAASTPNKQGLSARRNPKFTTTETTGLESDDDPDLTGLRKRARLKEEVTTSQTSL
jgi:hypothetical protein